jgi:hypothetical protein
MINEYSLHRKSHGVLMKPPPLPEIPNYVLVETKSKAAPKGNEGS